MRTESLGIFTISEKNYAVLPREMVFFRGSGTA